jgi:uncharacterized protein
MILIPHTIGPSEIAGLGLFTTVDVPAGTPVYHWDARFVLQITEAEMAAMPPIVAESVRKYSYRGRGAHRLDAAVYYCADDSRFMNHAAPASLVSEADGLLYRAARFLPAGSELTCDYAEFSEPGDFCFAFQQAV